MEWNCTWRYTVCSNAKSSHASRMVNRSRRSNRHIFPLLIVCIFTPINLTLYLTFSSAYQPPATYKGSANLTQIYSSVNSTNWVLIYRCQNCFIFDDPSQSAFNTSTSQTGSFLQGWAQSFVAPTDPKNPQSSFQQHNNGMGEFNIVVSSATHVSYSAWATKTVSAILLFEPPIP